MRYPGYYDYYGNARDITPTFAPIGPICQNTAAPALPATSNNGITGTWNPATINTAAAGTVTYTFTPDAGQCAIPATMTVTVTPEITPTFTRLVRFARTLLLLTLSGYF